jgi:uncharacterized metal-binding protein
MRVLLVMKRQISWQEQDLNFHSQDLNGPEPACSISVGVANKVVTDWTDRNHKKKKKKEKKKKMESIT